MEYDLDCRISILDPERTPYLLYVNLAFKYGLQKSQAIIQGSLGYIRNSQSQDGILQADFNLLRHLDVGITS